MLYYLVEYLQEYMHIPAGRLFKYISFRTAMAVILSLVITTLYGGRLINIIRNRQVGETVRELGLEGKSQKQCTTTIGVVIIIGCILVPTLLFAKLENIYIILMLVITVWIGVIGFVDDYIKRFRKIKEGLAGRFKII